MKTALDRFLRDCCQPTECNLNNKAFPLEYVVKAELIASPVWTFWLRFDADYAQMQVIGVTEDDRTYASEIATGEQLAVSWVLSQIKQIVEKGAIAA